MVSISLRAAAPRLSLAPVGLILVATMPYLLNDLVYLTLTDPLQLYLFDWVSRALFIAALVAAAGMDSGWLRQGPHPDRPTSRPTIPLIQAILLVPFVLIAARLVGRLVEAAWPDLAAATQLFDYPAAPNADFYWFDLLVGIPLVAVGEELAFRRVCINALQALGLSWGWAAAVSGLLFVLAHWSRGTVAMAEIAVWAAVLSLIYLRHRRLLPCVIVHYLWDLVVFA